MEEKSFSVFKDYLEYMEGISDEDLGKAMRAVWLYANGQEIPQLSGMAWMLFTTIRRDLDRRQAQKENGAKGGRPKTRENESGVSESETGVLKPETGVLKLETQVDPHNTKTVTKTVTKTKDRNTTPKSPQGDLFEQFWAAYPKKRSKGAARKAWDKLHADSTMLATILQAIQRAKQSEGWQKDGGQYIPYPATWLNAEGWEDEEPGPDPPPDRPPVVMNWAVPDPGSDNWEDRVP